jgi:SAM-dependent methyltransferase
VSWCWNGSELNDPVLGHWEELARLDAFWAILSKRERKFGRWTATDFFATGERQVAELMSRMSSLGYPGARGSAVDFGCGVGRLAPGLSEAFDSYVGIDVSAEMIERARQFHERRRNCAFVVGSDASLAALPTASVDLVISLLVLQHLPSIEGILGCVAELVRLLRPGGLLVMELPAPTLTTPFHTALHATRTTLYERLHAAGVPTRVLFRRLGLFPMGMKFVSQSRVSDVIETAGARLLAVDSSRTLHRLNRVYFAAKVRNTRAVCGGL